MQVLVLLLFFFFKQKTAYEIRLSLVGSEMCIRDRSRDHHPLMVEGGGTWSADVDGAVAGEAYSFVIDGPAGELWRKDPYGRDVDHSNGNSIVVDPAFDWSGDEGFR